MARPMAVFGSALLALALTLFAATRLGTEFLPTLEENNLWLRVTLPNTVDLDYSTSVSNGLRAFLRSQPEIETVSVQIGRPDDGTDSTGVFNQEYALYLKKPDQWPAGATKKDLVARIEKQLARVPGVEYYIQDNVAEALSGVKGENSVKIFGSDLDMLQAKATEVASMLRGTQGVVDVGIFRELGQPTLNVQVDRARCARFGVNVSDVQNLVQYALGGAPVTNVLENEKTFGLAIRLPQGYRENPDKIGALLVDTPDGQRVPLAMVADVKLTDGPFFVYREEGKRYIAIKFSVRNRDLGSAVVEVQDKLDRQIMLPQDYKFRIDGQANQMKAAQAKLMAIIPLTLLTIFLLLFSAFGNFRDAAIVLLNVPFAAIGGILALHLAGETLSISAGLGFLSLFGIAIQDGVILISYINKIVKRDNEDLTEAAVEGAALRLRPVIMTAMLSGFGLLPAALSHSIGSEAQRPLAIVIVGGVVTTTVLTLLVLPVVFTWANRARNRARQAH